MTLTTLADLPLQSPIPPESRTANSKPDPAVALADFTGVGLLHLRGPEAGFAAAFGTLPEVVGQVLPRRDGLAARLTHDEWMLIEADRSVASYPAKTDMRVTVTDVTHGYGVLLVGGARAREVLTKVCALDFSEHAFPDLYAAQTSFANVPALIVRRDLAEHAAYLIAVGRSLAEYVWDRLLDAAGEFDPVRVDPSAWTESMIRGEQT
ncbi:MAG: sarcosine oxidase subunit gamma [Candidatus Methylomirabilales bacterium]